MSIDLEDMVREVPVVDDERTYEFWLPFKLRDQALCQIPDLGFEIITGDAPTMEAFDSPNSD